MSYIKAYSDENRRHPDLYRLRLRTQEEAVERISDLCVAYKLAPIDVRFSKRNGAHYSREDRHLAFPKEGAPGWIYVAHEFAHYLTDAKRDAQVSFLQSEIDGCRKAIAELGPTHPARLAAKEAQKLKLILKRDAIKARRAHSKDFCENMDKVSAYIRTQGWLSGAVESAPLPTTPKERVDVVKITYLCLPSYLTCPRCRESLPKEMFGVRVVSRAEDGTPIKARPQSYCKDCRSK